MNCRRVRSVLSAYIDGELTGYEMLVLREHLSGCRECRDEHFSLKTIKYLLSALPEKEPNSDWAGVLAQSITKPAPTLADRLRAQWSRSVDSVVPHAIAEGGRKGLSLNGQRVAWALAACAFGAFLISPFDRAAPPSPAADGAKASIFSVPNPLPQSSYPSAQAAGVTHFIAIPLPTGSLSTNPAAAFPVRPIQEVDGSSNLREANDLHVVQGAGLSALTTPWPGQRMGMSPVDRIAIPPQPAPLGPGR